MGHPRSGACLWIGEAARSWTCLRTGDVARSWQNLCSIIWVCPLSGIGERPISGVDFPEVGAWNSYKENNCEIHFLSKFKIFLCM